MSERLKKACELSGIFERQRVSFLAQVLGISLTAVSKWFSDTSLPKLDKIEPLAKLLNVSIEWLIAVFSFMLKTHYLFNLNRDNNPYHDVLNLR